MKTFQDLQHAIETNTQDEFIFGAIADYKGSDTYKMGSRRRCLFETAQYNYNEISEAIVYNVRKSSP